MHKQGGGAAVIVDTDVREVDPLCVDVHKRGGGGAAVIADADMREVDPPCVLTRTNEGEHSCDRRCGCEGSRTLLH